MGIRALILSIALVFCCGGFASAIEPCAHSLKFLGAIDKVVESWNRPLTENLRPVSPPFLSVVYRIGTAFSVRERASIGYWQNEILSKLTWKPNYWQLRQSSRNALSIILSNWNLKRPLKNHRALVAYSLLHPLVDGSLDRGEIPPSSIAKIQQKLAGVKIKATSYFERDVFALLDIIEEEFPHEEHPLLQWLFLELFTAQLSAHSTQRSTTSTEEDLLISSFKKGGLCIALSAYIGQGYLSEIEFEFLVKQGALLQLADDLGDVIQDKEEGTRTLFTENFGAHNSADYLYKMVRLQVDWLERAPSELNRLSAISKLTLWFYLGRIARFSAEEIEPAQKMISKFNWMARSIFGASYFLHRRAFEKNLSKLQANPTSLPAEYFKEREL